MPGLIGVSTTGVGVDIVNYLKGVADFFGITIRVTSGYRSPDAQANAMFDNWVNLKHGQVYKTTTLPDADRVQLDNYWKIATGHMASANEKLKAKKDFLDLAKARVGSKSMHTRGRALDVSRQHIDQRIYHAIVLHLHDVKEGKRTDIYHFESNGTVPPVDAATKAKWQTIKDGSHHHHPHHRPHHLPPNVVSC